MGRLALFVCRPLPLSDAIAQFYQGRKKRAKPAGLATADTISAMKESHKQSGLHSSRSGVVTSMAVQACTSRAITGGADKTAIVFDLEKQEMLFTLKVRRWRLRIETEEEVEASHQQSQGTGS